MALAETIMRAVHKHRLVPKVTRLLPYIAVMFVVASVAWLLVLPVDGQYRNTYISENALMPAQVTSYFRESEWNIVRGYRSEVSDLERLSVAARNIVVGQWLDEMGIKTSYHTPDAEGASSTLYGIMHAARGDDTEAMVLSVPWTTSDGHYNVGGVALGLALMRYFNRMSIWSKNIIFVVPEDGGVALRSWVEAYHTSLDETAGTIEAAVVLEVAEDADYFTHYELVYEGLNGQLPNLDLLNTANLIASHENVKASIQNTPKSDLERNDYVTRLKVMVKGIVSLALAGVVRPLHGCEAFSGWQIQAFTLKGKGREGPNDITQIGRIVDSTFRSVNNLLEKFHQSFFYYLLLSRDHFVSIGTYLPSAVLVALSYVLSSLSCLLNSNVNMYDFVFNISDVILVFLGIELGSTLTALALSRLVKMTIDESDTEAFISLILIAFSTINIVLSLSPFYKHLIKFRFSRRLSYSLLAFPLFFIAAISTSLLIINFSLALSIGILAFPLTFVQQLVTSNQAQEFNPMFSKSVAGVKSKLKIFVALFITNPFFVIFLVGSLYISPDDGVANLMKSLLLAWDDLQCWTWYIIMVGWFPSWFAIALGCLLGDFSSRPSTSVDKKNQ